MKKFTATAVAATGFTALALGLTVPVPATGVGTETVTDGQADQPAHLCGSRPVSPIGHSTLTCQPHLALTPVTFT